MVTRVRPGQVWSVLDHDHHHEKSTVISVQDMKVVLHRRWDGVQPHFRTIEIGYFGPPSDRPEHGDYRQATGFRHLLYDPPEETPGNPQGNMLARSNDDDP